MPQHVSRSSRPLGITIICVVFFIAAALAILAGVGFFVLGTFLSVAYFVSSYLIALGGVVGGILLVVGFLYFGLGWGLWKAKNSARWIAITLCALVMVYLALITVASALSLRETIWLFFVSLVGVGVNGLIIAELLGHSAKSYFETRVSESQVEVAQETIRPAAVPPPATEPAAGLTPTTKYCPQCGAKIQRDSTYCEECGKHLANAQR